MKFYKSALIASVFLALASCGSTTASEYSFQGKQYIVIDKKSGLSGGPAERRAITRNPRGKWIHSPVLPRVIVDHGQFVRQIDTKELPL
jgi:hypothetical protein